MALKFISVFILCVLYLSYYGSSSYGFSDYKNKTSFFYISKNNNPVIGILTQEVYKSFQSIYQEEFHSFIAASYVKFIEGAGARVIPVWIGKNKDYYERIINKTNGLLLPGGATWFNNSKGYAEAGKILYNLAIEANDRGDYYPIFGACLGMELLPYLSAGEVDNRRVCDAYNIPMHLEFQPGFRERNMFGQASEYELKIFSTIDVAAHFHRFCITADSLREVNIFDEWHINSLNMDKYGFEFISSMEHRRYPFYGVAFHPEKNLYEWKYKKAILRTSESMKASQYFANFFVNQARYNQHTWANWQDLQRELIWNYPIVHTGLIPGSNYEQCYFFKGDETNNGHKHKTSRTEQMPQVTHV